MKKKNIFNEYLYIKKYNIPVKISLSEEMKASGDDFNILSTDIIRTKSRVSILLNVDDYPMFNDNLTYMY